MASRAGLKPFHVRKSVFEAVETWQRAQELIRETPAHSVDYPPAETILHAIPRREQLIDPDVEHLWMPFLEQLAFKNSFWQSLGRLFTWLNLLLTIALGRLIDRLLRRDTVERQAVRLRVALERAGGTFVKLGQQIAMRIDLVPWAYCMELSKMLDHMPAFSTEQALQAIERTIHRPWQDVFAVF